jgi:hypothetical protein
MSMTLAALQAAVLRRLDPEGSTPSYSAVHNDTIKQIAQEKTDEVILALEPQHYQALIEDGSTLTFTTSGANAVSALPSDYVKYVSVRVTISSILKRCFVFDNPDEYNRYDSRNFILTPVDEKPICKIMDGFVYVRPNDITSGDMDYVKEHPTLSGSQDTVFDSVGDTMLIKLTTEEIMKILELAVD